MVRKNKTISKKYKYKKEKEQFRDSYKEEVNYHWFLDTDNSYEYDVFPNSRNQVHRKFSTKQECSYFLMHKNEYREFNIRLRLRRSKSNLPNAWDDLPSYQHKLKKSWKHATKRKTQHYK